MSAMSLVIVFCSHTHTPAVRPLAGRFIAAPCFDQFVNSMIMGNIITMGMEYDDMPLGYANFLEAAEVTVFCAPSRRQTVHDTVCVA